MWGGGGCHPDCSRSSKISSFLLELSLVLLPLSFPGVETTDGMRAIHVLVWYTLQGFGSPTDGDRGPNSPVGGEEDTRLMLM